MMRRLSSKAPAATARLGLCAVVPTAATIASTTSTISSSSSSSFYMMNNNNNKSISTTTTNNNNITTQVRYTHTPAKRAVNAGEKITYPKVGNSIDQFKWINTEYQSPYEMSCPLDVIVLYNPSSHANNVAVDDLLKVWPKLRIVQTVVEGRTPVTGVTHQVFIPKNSWGDMEVFRQRYEEYCVTNRFMRKIRVGFYPVWSSMAEDSAIARKVIDMGLHWVGASPDSMDGLGKIEYKQFCEKFNIPTAPFFKLSPPDANMETEAAIKYMHNEYNKLVKGTPLEGKPCFVKSEYGGGGRGTKKAQPNDESIEAAIRGVLNDTKKIDGIYTELALDLTGASLYQLEMEVDAGSVVEGGRLVYFNNRNQKMIELGFSNDEITRFLPEDIYAGCIHATEVIARESKYNGRGTNEILIAKLANGEWKFFCSEFNKRVQVEHKALSFLKRYKNGELFNTIADQVMRSCGYRPPDYTRDLFRSGGAAVAHIRFIAPHITEAGEVSFPVGVEVDESIMPKGFAHALLHTGKLFADTDAQFGAALILGKDWDALLEHLKKFAHETVILGKNIRRDYFKFLQKFFHHPQVADLTLGCNRTFDVLQSPAITDSRNAEIVNYLNNGIARTLVNGYRPEGGVKNRGWPTETQLAEYVQLRDKLLMMPVNRENPFLRLVEHLDEERYYNELRGTLEKQGGGMVSVFPRDVQQECSGSESQLITYPSRLLMERVGPFCGFIGVEQGGAQYQTAEMNGINAFKVLHHGLLCNMPTFSLTRSHWMNALEKLSNSEVEFILKVTCGIVRNNFTIPEDSKIVPYFPYNFHAGNVPEQDEVTGLMLKAGMMPLPNFVWDPRFTMEHYEGWLKRQFVTWKKAGRKLHALRIKNAGQQREWTAENVFKFVQRARELYKEEYGPNEEPIMHIHNHNFNGMAPHVAYELLCMSQKVGYRYLVIDTAPPLMTHNNNLVVSKALTLDRDALDHLHFYNESAHTIWRMTERFHDFLQVRIDPNTIWAGGTGSSDLAAAEKIGIARSDIEDAKVLGARLSGLGGIVTPYSQWSMVIGYTCYKSNLRTFEAVEDHIKKGGTLNLPANILQGLDQWKTLLPRPPLVDKLLENHKAADPAIFKPKEASAAGFDKDAIIAKIRKQLPAAYIDDVTVARVLSFGDIAMKTLKAEDTGDDNNWLMRYPEIAYARRQTPGKSFAVRGAPVTFEGIEDIPDSANVNVTYKFEGRYVRVQTLDSEKEKGISRLIEKEAPMADPANPCHIGAFMPGVCESVGVKVGDVVKEGDVLYLVNSMKMVTSFKATKQHAGRVVEHIYASAGQELAFSNSGAAPLIMRLSDAVKK